MRRGIGPRQRWRRRPPEPIAVCIRAEMGCSADWIAAADAGATISSIVGRALLGCRPADARGVSATKALGARGRQP